MKVIEHYESDIEDQSASDYTHTETTTRQDPDQGKDQLASSETKTVRNLRLLVALVLLSCAIASSLLVYFYIQTSEVNEFHSKFEGDALKVLTAIGASMESTFTAVDSLVVNIVSFAEATNQTWPFVVVDDFAVRAKKTRALSDAVVLNMYQIVSDEERLDWEAFSATNNAWVDEALDIQEEDPAFTGPIVRNYTTVEVIHGYGEEESEFGTNRTGPYAVWWHSYPLMTSYPPYNWDLMSSLQEGEDLTILEHKLVELDRAYLIAEPDDYELQAENEIEADFYSDFIEPGLEPMEPISDVFYPILSNAHKKANFFYDTPEDIEQNKMVGILAASIYWRDYIQNILPAGSTGIIATFRSECNPTFTYQINGPEVVFVGTIDAHEPDPEFEDMAQSYKVSDLAQLAIEKTSYSGIPLNEEKCPVTVTIYPSTEMKDQYVTADGVRFAVIVGMTFVFTSFVFILYDFFVEKRQDVVLTSANKSNNIVTQLFPSNVRDRMYEAQDPIGNSSEGRRATKALARSDTELRSSSLKGRPIADLFPNSTVIFADLVGFTSWSSTRGPTEVFQLLETLYEAFDKIAARKGVFKIETIGDCYVAVTGLPSPQKYHALIMARFATACIKEIKSVTTELEETLGPGTSSLQLRVGLHSGPVTAGVLRGQKARFQIFGDTVNTAARMESTGKPMQIQVSQATAAAITAAGKSRWLEARPDVVHAKGKGEMQTYWLDIKDRGTLTGSVCSARDGDSSIGDIDSDDGYPDLAVDVVAAREEGDTTSGSKDEMETFDDEATLQGMDDYANC